MKTSDGTHADRNTLSLGTEGPFRPWEADTTALAGVLADAHADRLTLDRDPDEIADMIMRSRWLAAVRAQGRGAYARMTFGFGQPVDTDTMRKGIAGPFDEDENEHIALVQVLRSADQVGLTLARNFVLIAAMIAGSRWFSATITAAEQRNTPTPTA